MRNFFQKLGAGFARFMQGRYGSDQLSRFTMLLAVIMMFLSLIFRKAGFLYILVWVLIGYTYFRMLSRNIPKRYNENTRFLEWKDKIRARFGSLKTGNTAGNRKTSYSNYGASSGMRSDAEHRIFRCPACKQKVRVPRGKGKIEITCPKCGKAFVKRS